MPRERVRRALLAERGDTLLEVLISALMLAVIAVSTYTGMVSANRTTAEQRARSQADAIAQSEEEQVRAEPIEHLFEHRETFERTKEVTESGATYSKGSGYKGTIFTVKTTGEEKSESGGYSCSSGSTPTSGFYAETKTEVTWTFAHNATERVVETGIINQAASTSLIVRVVNRELKPLEGMDVSLAGDETETEGTSYSGTTSSNGCALFSSSSGGKWLLNVWRTGFGYVDPNWYAETAKDAEYADGVIQLVTNTPAKKEYTFERPGAIKVSFATRVKAGETPRATRAINAVAFQSGMSPQYQVLRRQEGTPCLKAAVYESTETVTSPMCVFPFTNRYTVFAGACEKNQPKLYAHEGAPYEDELMVEPEATATPAESLLIPALIVDVYGSSESSKISAPVVKITDTDTGTGGEGCYNTKQTAPTISGTSWTELEGQLQYPGEPFGTYTVCTEWTSGSGWSKTTRSARAENVKLTETEKGTVLKLFQTTSSKKGTNTSYESVYKEGAC
jgi:Tfp pilus assembly protein PilV